MKKLSTFQRLKVKKEAIQKRPFAPSDKPITPANNRRHFIPVICTSVKPVKRFPSILDAAHWLSIELQEHCSASALSATIRKGVMYKGFKFKKETPGNE